MAKRNTNLAPRAKRRIPEWSDADDAPEITREWVARADLYHGGKVIRRGVRAVHYDGSACPEGTPAIPRAFKPCCPEFGSHTLACYHDVRYEWWPRRRGWFTVIAPSAGGGGVAISFCPHCGSRLTNAKGGAKLGRRRRQAPLVKVLAAMPNVGMDSDFVRERPRPAKRMSQLRKT